MSRLPFEPERIRGPEAAGRPARRERKRLESVTEADQLTVSQAAELIKTTLEQRIPAPLRVVGEVSNLKTPGHWYFSLKDEHAVLQCVAWASSVKRFGFTPGLGDEVVATGHISHFAQQGRTQLYVTALTPVGAGALELRFRAMCEELRQAGYFDEARKRSLPAFPRRVAVVTSASGAALQDVMATARQRCPAVGLLVAPVRVQGDGAADEIARAIRFLSAQHEEFGVNAILVTRGGGSMEDLWAFNERPVADAVLASRLPVVAAIGHESDTTVIELVADLRAATPTQAAMRLIPERAELAQQLTHLRDRLHLLVRRSYQMEAHRLSTVTRQEIFRAPQVWLGRHRTHADGLARLLDRSIHHRVHREQARVERLAGRLGLLSPAQLLVRRRERMAILADRLARSSQLLIRQHRRRLRAAERELRAIDPRAVLRRGFSYTLDSANQLVRSIADIHIGETIRTHVADGSFHARVVPASSRRRGRTEADDGAESDQMDLFEPEE